MDDDQNAGPPRGILPPEAPPPGGGEGSAAWRLTFTYAGDDIRLVAQQRLVMVAPPDDSALTLNARAGTWLEVRDANGRGLYRQVLTDPVRAGYEVTPRTPDEVGIHVVPAVPTGAFTVVVPDLPGAYDVVLHRLTAEDLDVPRARRAADRPIASPVLTEILVETGPFEVG
jgi:hypothetical protein